MVDQRMRGILEPAIKKRVYDHQMLAHRRQHAAWGKARVQADQPDLVGVKPVNVAQNLVVHRGDQAIVKGPIRVIGFPQQGLIDPLGRHLEHRLCAVAQRGKRPPFRPGGQVPAGTNLKIAAHLKSVSDEVLINGRDSQAPLRQQLDQPFALQDTQGIAKRAHRHVQRFAQFAQRQELSGPDLGLEERALEGRIGRVAQHF